MPVSVVIDWYGPFSCETIPDQRWWRSDEKLLYMALRSSNVCSYVGRTQQDPRQRLSGHSKVAADDKLYVGRVSTPGKSGPRATKVPQDLRAAEQAFIFALKPERNENFMDRPPDDCVVVYSRTFDHPETEEPTTPEAKFPTLVVYDPALETTILHKGAW